MTWSFSWTHRNIVWYVNANWNQGLDDYLYTRKNKNIFSKRIVVNWKNIIQYSTNLRYLFLGIGLSTFSLYFADIDNGSEIRFDRRWGSDMGSAAALSFRKLTGTEIIQRIQWVLNILPLLPIYERIMCKVRVNKENDG